MFPENIRTTIKGILKAGDECAHPDPLDDSDQAVIITLMEITHQLNKIISFDIAKL